MNRKTMQIYRQGDVLLVRVADDFAVVGEPVAREQARLILARGEATGHAHALDSEDGELYEHPTTKVRHLRVVGTKAGGLIEGTIIVKEPRAIRLRTARYGTVAFPRTLIARTVSRGLVIRGPWGLLRHDEHDGHACPPGTYRVQRQREYSPSEIMTVAD